MVSLTSISCMMFQELRDTTAADGRLNNGRLDSAECVVDVARVRGAGDVHEERPLVFLLAGFELGLDETYALVVVR